MVAAAAISSAPSQVDKRANSSGKDCCSDQPTYGANEVGQQRKNQDSENQQSAKTHHGPSQGRAPESKPPDRRRSIERRRRAWPPRVRCRRPSRALTPLASLPCRAARERCQAERV